MFKQQRLFGDFQALAARHQANRDAIANLRWPSTIAFGYNKHESFHAYVGVASKYEPKHLQGTLTFRTLIRFSEPFFVDGILIPQVDGWTEDTEKYRGNKFKLGSITNIIVNRDEIIQAVSKKWPEMDIYRKITIQALDSWQK